MIDLAGGGYVPLVDNAVTSVEDAPPAFVRLAAHPIRWRLLRELVRSDRAVWELTGLVDEPQSLVSYHLRQLRDGGLVVARRSAADGRDSYYAIDLASCQRELQAAGGGLHPALGLAPLDPIAPAPGRSRAQAARVVPVHGQQRTLPDRGSTARAHVRRCDRSIAAPGAIPSRCIRTRCGS